MSNEVKFTISASSFLLFYFLQVFIGFTSGNVFVIRRNGYRGIFDSFTVPSSICTKPIYELCPPFQANRFEGQDCSCHCPVGKNTFVFHDDEWTCLENGKLRELQECSKTVYFYLEYPRNRLRAINIGDEAATKISSRWQSGWQMCEVNLNSSWYLECNGLRQRSSHYLGIMKELFTLVNVSRFYQNWQFALKVKRGVSGAAPFEGKIINLGIRCTNYSQIPYHGCLMFKLRGRQTCNVSVPSLQMSSPTLELTAAGTATPTPTVRIPPQSVTTMLFDSSSTAPGSRQTKNFVTPSYSIGSRSAASTSLEPTTPARSIVTVLTTITSPPSVRPRPSSGREQSTDKGPSSLGLIAGVTVSIVMLVVFFIAFVVYRRRCTNKKSGASTASTNRKNTQDSVMMSTQTNSAFQCDDGNEYKSLSFKAGETQIYASMYNVPQRSVEQEDPKSDHFYAVLNNQDGQSIYGPGNAQEPVYNVLEETGSVRETPFQSYGSIRPDQPVYHAGNNVAERTYNVLEDPDLENAESPNEHGTFSTQGPIYNTLEEPYSGKYYKTSCNYECTSEPVYNVLEEET